MTQYRKRRIQPPPPGFVWARDYRDPDTGNVLPGIATRLGISYETYRKWRMRDQGPTTVIVGNKLAARIETVEAYLVGLEQAAVADANAARDVAENDSRPAEARVSRNKTLTAA